jgi:hypothetical protein
VDCDDTTRLPWNTTKTGLDEGDEVYRRMRSLMIQAAEPVVRFLDNVKKETDGAEDKTLGALRGAITGGDTKPVLELATKTGALPPGKRLPWKAPALRNVKIGPKKVRITFEALERDVEAAKAALRVDTKREVGERVFEYYVEAEL